MPFAVCKVPMEHVQDTAGLEAAMREWKFGADDIGDAKNIAEDVDQSLLTSEA